MSLVVINPPSEQPIAELECAGVEQADAAVGRAKAAYTAWRAVSPSERGRRRRRLATVVDDHAEKLARIESGNVGKLGRARRDRNGSAGPPLLRRRCRQALRRDHAVAAGMVATFREPLGVVGLGARSAYS